MHKDFMIVATVTKAYKAADGRPFGEGIASNTDVDMASERMDCSVIQATAAVLKRGLVESR